MTIITENTLKEMTSLDPKAEVTCPKCNKTKKIETFQLALELATGNCLVYTNVCTNCFEKAKENLPKDSKDRQNTIKEMLFCAISDDEIMNIQTGETIEIPNKEEKK